VTLKVKFNDFEIITRSKSVPIAVSSCGELEWWSVGLLKSEMPVPKPVRLLGISLSALHGEFQANSVCLSDGFDGRSRLLRVGRTAGSGR
jgi:hypothetical protein